MHTTDEGLAVGLPGNNDGGGTLLPNVFFVTSNKIFKSRIPVGKGRCFRSDHAWPWLIPFATVPRSGTTFLRRVFEVATGLATEIEYWESGSCKRMLNAPFSFILYTDCIDGWARPKQVKHNLSGFHCCAHNPCKTELCGCASKNGESMFPRFAIPIRARIPFFSKHIFLFINLGHQNFSMICCHLVILFQGLS